MKNYFLLILIIFINSNNSAQVFNKVYDSFRPRLRTADAITGISLSYSDNKPIFIASLLGLDSILGFSFATKVDESGNIIWSKLIADSILAIEPRAFIKIKDEKYLVCGAKYPVNNKSKVCWYGIYSNEMELLEEHSYPTEFDNPIFEKAIQKKNGNYVFCGGNSLLDNRGNGASDRAKALIMEVDSNGNKLWQYEFWDSTQIHDLHSFFDLTEDQYGNIYACGTRYNADQNYDGILVKVNNEGKLIWFKQIFAPNYTEGFISINENSNGKLTVIGQSSNPDFLDTPWSEICYHNIDTSGKVIKTKRYFRKYTLDVRQCVTNKDESMTCGGSIWDSANSWINGLIFKISPEGNLNWTHVLDHADWNLEQLYTIGAAEDGGYYLGGFSWYSKELLQSKPWLVKTDSLGCDARNCANTQVINIYKDDFFKLYPNPIQDKLNIYHNNETRSEKKYIFECYDQNGKMVLAKSIFGMKSVIEVSFLNSGMYFYRIHDSKKVVQSGKMVKGL